MGDGILGAVGPGGQLAKFTTEAGVHAGWKVMRSLDGCVTLEQAKEALSMLKGLGVGPCPECAAGKHRNCDGTTWSNRLDERVTCPCSVGYNGLEPHTLKLSG